VVRAPPAPLEEIYKAILADVQSTNGTTAEISLQQGKEPTSMQVQTLLRHAMSETISEGIVNCLMVTDSGEANVQLTRIHEHIFSRMSFVSSNPSSVILKNQNLIILYNFHQETQL
jgi:hypothetical protein